MEPKYKRILIKLSGEALAGEKGVGNPYLYTVQTIAKEIAEVHSSGVEIALVIGGGKFGVKNQLLKLVWIAYKPITLVC